MYPARVIYGVLFFSAIIAVLLVMKPRAMFEEDGRPKPFGTGEGKTLFSFGAITCLLAVTCFFVFGIIDMVYSCSNASANVNARAATNSGAASFQLHPHHPPPSYIQHYNPSTSLPSIQPSLSPVTAPMSMPFSQGFPPHTCPYVSAPVPSPLSLYR